MKSISTTRLPLRASPTRLTTSSRPWPPKQCPKYAGLMEQLLFSNAFSEVFRLVSRANKYIDETMPWKLAKDEASRGRLQQVLYNLCEALRIVAILCQPAMPDTSAKILSYLGVDEADCTWDTAGQFRRHQGLPHLQGRDRSSPASTWKRSSTRWRKTRKSGPPRPRRLPRRLRRPPKKPITARRLPPKSPLMTLPSSTCASPR